MIMEAKTRSLAAGATAAKKRKLDESVRKEAEDMKARKAAGKAYDASIKSYKKGGMVTKGKK
jgi:hypothetical protein